MTWRLWRGEVAEPDGSFRRLTGHAIGWLYIASAAVIFGYAPTVGSARRILAVLLGLGAATMVCGVVMLWLPWHRWGRRWQVLAIPPSLAMSGFGNWMDPNPYLAGISFFVLAVWAGTALRRGAVLALSPLFMVAYWFPLAIVAHEPRLASSAVTCTVICVITGECLAWLTARLHGLQARLREHDERRFQALVAASSDTTILLDPEGRASYVSPSATHLLGRPAEALQGRTAQALIADHVHPDDASAVIRGLRLLSVGRGSTTVIRFRAQHTDGTVHDIEGVGRDLVADEAVNGTLINLRDVSDRVALERALTHQAFSDQLTGLPNRLRLHDLLGQAMRTAGQRLARTALLLTDLNRFKDINDTLGHHYGDRLLAQVAERLVQVLRDTGTVARLGGDEFAVLLPVVDSADAAVRVAAKLHSALEQPFYLDDLSVEVDAGIGLAIYPDHATDPDELLRMADIAMYAAKTAHLEHQVFEAGLDKHSARKLALLGQIRTGIAEGQMVLHYQPKVDARTGLPIGAEALVRWQHPDFGLLGPGEFVGLAEATGLIHPLTFHVLESALRQQRRWLDAGHHWRVAVNLSPHCLRDPAAPARVARLLSDTGVPAELLILEITESAVMADSGRAVETLNQLHELGVRLSIDDFGTEYSSLGRLKDLPVDELKIDRSFVSAVRTSRRELAIARSIIELGHSLGLEVVAEGVEDRETWTELELLGCDVLQGFYIAKPLPADEMPAWLATWPPQRILAAAWHG